MGRLETYFIKSDEHKRLFDKFSDIEAQLKINAIESDKSGAFSFSSIALLKSIDYHKLTVPKADGGLGGGLYELVLFQERLAQCDPAIALAFGWHLSCVLDINEKKVWELNHIKQLNEKIVSQSWLINRAATEPTSGSPTRGSMPQTEVTLLEDKQTITISGKKSYTSLSPVLNLYLVTATYNGDRVEVAIPAHTAGVSIIEDWDMVGMKGTASHLLVLDDVKLDLTHIYYTYPKQTKDSINASLLHIPACYLGIALAARKEAVLFANEYQPPSLDKPIIYTPNVQLHLGEIELALQTARAFMYATASDYSKADDTLKQTYLPALQAVKISAMRAALDIVDRAMKIVGLKSLSAGHTLQRLYRDVRFGLHNPPMEDAVLFSLGRKAVEDLKENK